VGLMQLKELSQEGLEFMIHERSKHGPFPLKTPRVTKDRASSA
jgi:hypothetical protein